MKLSLPLYQRLKSAAADDPDRMLETPEATAIGDRGACLGARLVPFPRVDWRPRSGRPSSHLPAIPAPEFLQDWQQ